MTNIGIVMLLGISMGAGGSADDHLLAGARHFREARYAEALVEFRVAQSLGASDAQGYSAAALVKLGRPEEAIEAFDGAPVSTTDALLQYYRACAYYGARLYSRASAVLADVPERSGPQIAAQVTQLRARIATELAKEPVTRAIDGYLKLCAARSDAGRRALAGEYCREAAALATRRPDRYGLTAATAKLAQLKKNGARQ